MRRTAIIVVPLLLALLGAPLRAQEWRPIELDVPEDGVNDALARQHEDAEYAARIAPPPPPAESLGEALKALERTLVHAGRPRLEFKPDRIVLQVFATISVLIDSTYVELSFDLEPRVTAPNVIELVVHGGRERWKNKDWADQTEAGLSANVRRLVDTMTATPGAEGVRLVRGQNGAPDRIVVDLSGTASLQGVELTGLTARQGALTLRGRTTRDRLALPLDSRTANDALHEVANDPAHGALRALLPPEAWLDVGHDHPGRLTLHSTADLPWLPATRYEAVFKLEVTGPHRLRVTLEDVTIGGDTMDSVLRSRAGAGLKRWLMARIYARLDAEEAAMSASYARGESNLRMSHDAARPEVRVFDLRPGWAGPAAVRPGFDLESLTVVPGEIDLAARLAAAPATPEATAPAPVVASVPSPAPAPGVSRPNPPPPPSRGIIGALGD